jgi:hypothetical protein
MLIVSVLLPVSTLMSQERTAIEEAIRLNDFGVEAAKKGLWTEASIRWQQSLRVYPNFPAAHNNLAVVYEHFGNYSQALEHYAKALDFSNSARYISSNNRMFQQFYAKHVQTLDEEKRRTRRFLKESRAGADDGDMTVENSIQRGPDIDKLSAVSDKLDQSIARETSGATYHKVGSSSQVFIKHPRRQTSLSGKFRRVYIAGFAPIDGKSKQLNFETTEFLRSELRKHAMYNVIPIDELALPADDEEFDRIIDDYEFWQRLGNKVGADLIIYGLVNFYGEPSDGYYPYEYQDNRGNHRTAQIYVRRTAFTIELDLFFHESSTGELIHQESFGQTIVYRGRLEPDLQSFYDVMHRVLPRFMDLMVPREHDAIRFLLYG